MKTLKQLLIIIAFTLCGEWLTTIFSLPIPGSMIGLLLLFGALQMRWLDVSDVADVGLWLKDNLAFFFVPATVGIMSYFDLIQATWLQLVLIIAVSTLVTYLVTAFVAQKSERIGS